MAKQTGREQEQLQQKLQAEVEKYKELQNDVQKSVSSRNQLDAQLNENQIVKNELDRLDSSNNVYKLIGPVLVKQDLLEAKQNVQKRIEYIENEISRQEKTTKDLKKKQDSIREDVTNLQQQFQKAQLRAAGVR
ncbi:Prefoldin subunit 6 [Trichoplax sp. H2]|uniref:Prefoldin subunit 6 n=1 Tax=Trichoplax adhaerens TaxID=10228 RepID=B3RNZ6_TRIAD|nr:hypothetical protein TRIADDRAFT_53348 [Trichoplax adhaerens]EDV27545.1 hypothetical protein TRIADDRAFT_53348 [Trichoplax adhaerens]RDD43470.1 Prefoldin subunit 6 [Trichoplax sp. H2]|eukprot:XP_002109379.1 hypothetical protein TRIADDRAFT_53348 [Trichoplax adhaerens]